MDENTTNNDETDLAMTAADAASAPADTTEETTTEPKAAPAPTSTAETNVVFVGSLAWATTDETLRAHFENAGLQIGEDEVAKSEYSGKEFTRRAVTVARYPDTKKSRGYGFVTLATPAEAQKAVDSLNDSELDGRNIRVQLKDMTPREDRPRKPSYGSGNGGGGSYNRGGSGGSYNNKSGGGYNNKSNYNRGGGYESNNDSWAA